MSRALALMASALILVGCAEDAKPRATDPPDVRAELALLRAGLPLTQVDTMCQEGSGRGCPNVGLRARSTASPDQLLTQMSAELERQRWAVMPGSCRVVPRQCGVTATKPGDRGPMRVNFTATADEPGPTSVRIGVFYA